MKLHRSQLEELLNKPSLTDLEKQLLLNSIGQSDSSDLLELLLEKFSDDLVFTSDNSNTESVKQILANATANETQTSILPSKRKIIPYRGNWWAAAAVVLLLISATIWKLRPGKNSSQVIVSNKIIKEDVAAPEFSRPTIILADGKKILLDSNKAGMLANEGGMQINRTAAGVITYRGTENTNEYNTLVNPRGSKPVSLKLSDGSSIWLNSESSLRYPISFNGSIRQVEITGEAYFEVAKNASKPFRVSIGEKAIVEVLGTHFNINSYQNELNTHVTLLEGSVRVTSTSAVSAILHPGQQAVYSNSPLKPTSINIKEEIDLNAVVAWKNGYFNFQHADLYAVMRQLARWYNIDIEYEGTLPVRYFGGEMQRDLNLSEVLKLLEKNNVHFRIENRKLIVKP